MKYGYKCAIIRDPFIKEQLRNIHVDQLFTESHPFANKRTALENLLLTNQHNQEGSLLTRTEFFTELQSTLLSHSYTFAIEAAKQLAAQKNLTLI